MPSADSPWEVPQTAEGRDLVLQRIAAFEQSGNLLEAGRGLTKLALLCRSVGPPEGESGDICSASAERAIQLLRQFDDKGALATALRVSAIMLFFTPEPSNTRLSEALELSKQAGDLESQGWTLYAMSKVPGRGRSAGEKQEVLAQAAELFQASNCPPGEACVLQTQAISLYDEHPGTAVEMFSKAAQLFEASGDHKSAARALFMGQVFGRAALDFEGRRSMLDRAALLNRRAGDDQAVALTYRNLASLCKDHQRTEEASAYRALEDTLDIAVYGSRRARLLSDIDHLKEILHMSMAEDRPRLQREMEALEAELQASSQPE